jgi:hypothetical protein
VAKLAVRVGQYHLGIQTDDPAVAAAVAARLSQHLVDDPATPANVSIHSGSPPLPGSRPIYRVYEGCNPVFLSPALDRAVTVAAERLEPFLPASSPDPTLLRLRTSAAIGDGRAVLLPASMPMALPSLEVRLRATGAQVLARATIDIHPGHRELVLRPSPLTGRLPVGDDLGSPGTRRVASRRHTIVGWLFEPQDVRSRATGGVRRADALARALWLLAPSRPTGADLRQLAHLVEGIETRQTTGPHAPSAIRLLLGAMR